MEVWKNNSIMPETNEESANSIESLLNSAANYGKISYDLVKLKTIDKVSNVVSTLIPNAIVFLILMTFLFFLSFGLSYYLGEILGSIFYGFLVVALVYGIIGLIVHFFFHDPIKKKVSSFIVRHALK